MTFPDHRPYLGKRYLVFDNLAWAQVGHDVGNNSVFWRPATIEHVLFTHDDRLIADVRFDHDNRLSAGHFIDGMKEIKDDALAKTANERERQRRENHSVAGHDW